MAMGTNYVRNREYEQERVQYQSLMASATSNSSNVISSGATIVEGIYYMWNENGFTGNGWMYEIEGSPTNKYPDFKNDEDVAEYVENTGNLDAVFSSWSMNYTLADWHRFYTAVGVNSGCMDVVHGQA